MFSGIVEEVGAVAETDITGRGRLRVTASLVLRGVRRGDSIAVNGCCLTVAEAGAADFVVDVMPETARRTNLGGLVAGDAVNLEAALALGDRIGGHLVTGHVDCVGVVAECRQEDNARWITISTPPEMAGLIAPRGCVALDGISLTVVGASDDSFTASLIPETLTATTAGSWSPQRLLNLEVDLIARYVQRSLDHRAAMTSPHPGGTP